ncbi:uncharacterized protein [Epargyreus clarus]|uniref:uncharacterized protein n=1 Tax=Epargyreus clarus TaxID=520877 RepID=UPI003C2CB359
MLFNEKLDLRLIQLVKENPILYDNNHGKYMDFNAREVAWQKIGDELRQPAGDCKVRWINIRDVNRRTIRQNIRDPNARTRTYKYEKELYFMRPYYKDVMMSNVESESDERNNDADEEFHDNTPNDDWEDKPKQKVKLERSIKKSNTKKKKMSYDEEPIPLHSFSFPETSTPSEFDPTDTVDAFLLSIGATLKTFSPYHLNLAKSKIFSVVQEHDLQQIVQKEQHEVSVSDVKVSASDPMYLH